MVCSERFICADWLHHAKQFFRLKILFKTATKGFDCKTNGQAVGARALAHYGVKKVMMLCKFWATDSDGTFEEEHARRGIIAGQKIN